MTVDASMAVGLNGDQFGTRSTPRPPLPEDTGHLVTGIILVELGGKGGRMIQQPAVRGSRGEEKYYFKAFWDFPRAKMHHHGLKMG